MAIMLFERRGDPSEEPPSGLHTTCAGRTCAASSIAVIVDEPLCRGHAERQRCPFRRLQRSPAELLIVLAVVLLLFGSRKLPELARGLGQAAHEFRRGREEADPPKEE